MAARHPLWMSVTVGLLTGCPKQQTPTAEPPNAESSSTPATATQATATLAPSSVKGATAQAASDPWAQAQAIAQQTGAFGVARWDDDVPYLFQAKMTRGILVHHGAVVTARGPAAAAAYLRDVGILDGKG